MDILFIASTAVITSKPFDKKLFLETLGLPLEAHGDPDYLSSEAIEGCKHFGVWPLDQAADACFGVTVWPGDRPVPQASIEFEVGSAELVAEAEAELISAGYPVLHGTKTEPWGQTVCRFQDVDGSILGISFAPWMHPTA